MVESANLNHSASLELSPVAEPNRADIFRNVSPESEAAHNAALRLLADAAGGHDISQAYDGFPASERSHIFSDMYLMQAGVVPGYPSVNLLLDGEDIGWDPFDRIVRGKLTKITDGLTGKRLYTTREPSIYRTRPGDTVASVAAQGLNSCRDEDKPVYATSEQIKAAAEGIAQENGLLVDQPLKQGSTIIIDGRFVAPDRIPDKPVPVPGMPLETFSLGGEEHRFETAKQVLQALPTGMQDFLQAGGTTLIVSADFCHEFPSKAMTTPLGYADGETYLRSPATYSRAENQIVVRQMVANEKGERFWVLNDSLAASVRHETGHAVDHLLGDFSEGSEFSQAYASDVANLTAKQQTELSYYLIGSNDSKAIVVGQNETFAQVFSALYTSEKTVVDRNDTIYRDNKAMLAAFPKVAALIQRKLAILENGRTGPADPSDDF
jgi:hypothetical protein